MPRITFQQGVALALGAYIDPLNESNNKRFTLVCENNDTALNYNGVFGRNPSLNNAVDNRLSSLFHGKNAGETDMRPLDFATLPIIGNLPDQVYYRWRSVDVGGAGGNPSNTGLRLGGDVDGDNSFETFERNLHRTGLAIWNKLKK